ncbi:MAG: hypothetical protein M1834_005652 [Cirrosporium novae-zelandiae]|nr:MAG: hypothetical protein M1834_005652 [Cirrosporium novae-zelandiae]
MEKEDIDVESKRVDDSAQVDDALRYLNHEDTTIMSEIDEKKLVRKIDWMIVPLMCQLCRRDGDQFSLLALVFYVTYLAFELPTGYLMQRLPTAKYLGVNVILWGLIVACNAAADNFGGLIALRVMLGCFESSVAPALNLITTMWYKKNEQPLRVGFWYVGTGTGTIIGSLLSFGFQHYRGSSFHSWQIMFLVVGLVTITVGIVVVFLLPDNPMKSRLSHDEKIWAIERLRENQTGIENKRFKPKQALECFQDVKTWLLVVITIASTVPNGAVSSFQATVIKSLGFSSEQTALLSIPSGTIGCISVMGACYCASRFNQRAIFIVLVLLPGGILGGGLLAFLPSDYKIGRLMGNYLTNCIGASLPLLYSWVGCNYAGHTKKVTMNAVLLMAFCLGNIIGPETFRDKDKPEYTPAKIAIVATCAIAIVFTIILRFVLAAENKRRDQKHMGDQHKENQEFLDMTDKENPEFRYRLNRINHTTHNSDYKAQRPQLAKLLQLQHSTQETTGFFDHHSIKLPSPSIVIQITEIMFLSRTAGTLARRAAPQARAAVARRAFTISVVRRDAKHDVAATPAGEGKIKVFHEVKTETDLLAPGAKPGTVPTDLEQSTGLERLEILGKMEGVDIFDMKPLDSSRLGTLENPIMVKSMGDEQYAGCTGVPADSHPVKWLTMTRSDPIERCPECGNVLKMEYVGPADDPHGHHVEHSNGRYNHSEPKIMADFIPKEYRWT